jgi:hypothetical protein
VGRSGLGGSRLDLQKVEDALRQFYANGLAASTQKSYSSGQKRFLSFCNKFNLSAIPPSEHTLLLFISQLGVDGLSLATIKSYLSSVRNLLINAGITAPIIYTPRVELIIRGIKRSKVGFGAPNQCRLPITPDILLKLKGVWSLLPLTADKMMLWAAVCLGFFGFLRCAEFTVPSLDTYDVNRHLSFQDIGLCHPPNVNTISICIKCSKTDQLGKGVQIFLSRTSGALCPVSALLEYLSVRGTHEGPLFMRSGGLPLSRAFLVAQVQSALQLQGMAVSHFTGHSFRIGAATTALRAGISDAKIKMLGRWESSAYQSYLRTPREELSTICTTLAHTRI